MIAFAFVCCWLFYPLFLASFSCTVPEFLCRWRKWNVFFYICSRRSMWCWCRIRCSWMNCELCTVSSKSYCNQNTVSSEPSAMLSLNFGSPLFTSSIIGSITKSDQAPTNVSAGAWKYVVNQIAAASLILSVFKNKVKTSYFTLASQAIILKQFN